MEYNLHLEFRPNTGADYHRTDQIDWRSNRTHGEFLRETMLFGGISVRTQKNCLPIKIAPIDYLRDRLPIPVFDPFN